MKRVVITGIGTVNPLGNNINEYWNNLIKGVSGASLITKFNATHFKTKFACEVKNFDPGQYIEKSEARKMDLFTQYAIAATDQCTQDAGFNKESWNMDRMGVIWATGIGGIGTFDEVLKEYAQNMENPRFGPFFITKIIPNMASGHISIRYGILGVSYTIISACASSNSAIADAFNYIRLGKADTMIAGGSEAAICESAVGGFNGARALSTNNENYQTASKPFDKDRDGFVLGEGAGAIMLEEYEHAKKRGAKIYCELVGTGMASDAFHVTATHPDGLGAIRAMKEALNEASLLPSDVDYVNAHATATPMGDPCECKAIETVFDKSIDKLNISATKSMTGHLLGAAGVVEAIACILSIKHNKIPPTINFNELDPAINPKLNFTPNKAVDKEVKVAMNNTFGFGGHIGVTVFKKVE
jgi:3-oxoacyl-[acyl-carrier-protein] synthase II